MQRIFEELNSTHFSVHYLYGLCLPTPNQKILLLKVIVFFLAGYGPVVNSGIQV